MIRNLNYGSRMLKPVDIVVFAALIVSSSRTWTQAELGRRLGLSQATVHRAFKQLEESGLKGPDGLRAHPFRGVVIHAVRTIYPAHLGAPSRGVPTAHAGPGSVDRFPGGRPYVWPSEEGDAYGPGLDPLHPSVPSAALDWVAFHELMALIDVFRIGRVRERAAAQARLDAILEAPR
jgi:hypothetical protein